MRVSGELERHLLCHIFKTTRVLLACPPKLQERPRAALALVVAQGGLGQKMWYNIILVKNIKKIPKLHRPERHLKGWGFEDWVCNGSKYCGKLLFFSKGKRCSFHYHKKKHETFHLFSGKMKVLIGWENSPAHPKIKTLILKPGDCLEIPVGLRHQMIALEDSNLFEFSTTHFEDDSLRIIKGD